MKRIAATLAFAVFAMSATAAEADGKAVFQKSCAACHQASGKGIPGAFPALAGNAFCIRDRCRGPRRTPPLCC
ncbi:cytochrome c [[Empedobacter] haloabium]|uniref:Cytochrome c n=1 Tax=[Empedobacter] haloabium TaxID=592317 RepID=A0ABZ1UJ87_9BURK